MPESTSLKRKAAVKSQKQPLKKRKVEPNPQSFHASQCDANWKKLQAEFTKKNADSTRPTRTKKLMKKPVTKKQMCTEVWFDGVSQDEILLAEGISKDGTSAKSKTEEELVKENAFGGMTKAIGIDCEMVGTGKRGSRSALARVSLVNQYGKRIYDKHVKVDEEITDYRTWVSGIRPSDLAGAEEFSVVQKEVAEILKDRILVGHALHHDLKALYLDHPKRLIRDSSMYAPFLVHNNGKTPSLRLLSAKLLGVQVQSGEHSSVQDAQAAMKLYMMHKNQWEKELKKPHKKVKKQGIVSEA